MNKKGLIMAILLLFIVILSVSSVSAEDTAYANSLQEADDIATISETNESTSSSEQTVPIGSDSDAIQSIINGLSDGDTLTFETGEYKDICIYVNKSITINGNGATLIGYDNPSKNNTPSIIWNPTSSGGYAIGNLATLYVVNANNVVIHGLTVVGGENSSATYSNALVYATKSNSLIFENNTLDGSSWGLYLQYCNDGIISENTIQNQAVTGLLNFGSARTIIEKNTFINAANHGIDVRHGTGPNVQVINNTVIGSKEGIYLMHSKGHSAYNNTLINCTISSISCYGSSNIDIRDNKMQKSRIGVLLGGGYTNITIGENQFSLDNLPFPPTFVYYVAEAKSDYQNAEDIMGTFSDSTSNSPNYIAYTEIEAPADISIDYNTIMKKTGTQFTVPEEYTNDQIQTMLEAMEDGDSIIFYKNAVYTNISIYTDKNIKIFGNNATLIGFDNIDLNNVPEKVRASTTSGGYAIAYRSVLYVINTTGAVVTGLNIQAQYPGYDTTKVGANTDEYKTSGIYASENKNLVITGCDVTGASWGIFGQYSSNSIISRNNVHDIYTTGIMNFGSPNAIIVENNITDAVNHGIDTRHGTGPNVTIAFNTISGAKEGIYLMHSKGHTVYNNTVLNSKISGITAYGSGNEKIFNNSISGSRIGILMGGGYYNVTVGENSYNLDFLPFPPTFVTYLARAESMYQTADDVMRTYSDKELVTIDVDDVDTLPHTGQLDFTLIDQNGKKLENTEVTVDIDTLNSTVVKTDDEGSVSIPLDLDLGEYVATITYAGSDNYGETSATAFISVVETIKTKTEITAEDIAVEYNSAGELIATLTNKENGVAIKGANLRFYVNDAKTTVKTDKEGKAALSLNGLTPDTYEATIVYEGNSKYKAATTTVQVTIEKATTVISAEDIIVEYNSDGELVATLTNNATGKAITSANVRIYLNDVKTTVKTDKEGKAALSLNGLTPDTYEATIVYEGNSKYEATTTTVQVTITKATTIASGIYDTETNEMVVTVTNAATGAAIKSANVVFTLNGVKTTVKTDKDGQARLSLGDVDPNSFTAAFSYGGNSKYLKSTGKISAVVNKTTTIISTVYDKENDEVVSTLTNAATGAAIKGATVVFNVDGAKVSYKTDASGQVKYSTADLSPDVHSVASSYGGNSKYAGSNISINIVKI